MKKYLPVPEEDGNSSLHDGSASPASMTSFGATSLQDQDGGGAGGGGGAPLTALSQSAMEDYCRDLLEVVDRKSVV